MTIERRGYLVHGRVQGVGFRWWTARLADRLGLAGAVRNLSDGSVRVTVEGPPARLDEIAGLLREGPPGARVEALESVEPEAGPDRDGFRIER